MTSPRYDTSGVWYKGNTHIHSTASDGGLNFEQLAERYARAGYDFLCRTDHWVTSRVDPAADSPVLWLDGVELHGFDDRGAFYHVVGLGRFDGLREEDGLVDAMDAVRAQGGLLILAHPFWTGNSFEEARRWRFDGVEIYNHVCLWLNGKADGAPHWNAMLEDNPSTLALAVDDAHITGEHPGWNGGWIMVNAPTLKTNAILEGIGRGNFYSTCGPDFYDIEMDGPKVRGRTSPVQYARLVGAKSRGRQRGNPDGGTFDTFEFTIPDEWPYAYIEIEDENGLRAWTNTLLA